MVEFTKEERNIIYSKALEYMNREWFMCCAIVRAVYNTIPEVDLENSDVEIYFPELKSFKPKIKTGCTIWFPMYDKHSRIDILIQCVKMTE
jgi:hypothetical protein